MELTGKVIGIKSDTKPQLVTVKLDKQAIKNSCTVRVDSGADGTGCPASGCADCQGCSQENATGVFVVSGDTVDAVNAMPRPVSEGDAVCLEIAKKEQVKQTIMSVLLPLILAALGFFGCLELFQHEAIGIIGLFAGMLLGMTLSLLYGRKRGTALLPRIVRRIG